MEIYVGLFPGNVEEVRHVRAAVCEYLNGCPVVDYVILIVSELAANAARHSDSKDSMFTVQVERHEHWVHIAVTDAGGPWIKREMNDDYPHGLEIVARLTKKIGILSYTDSKERIVFCTLYF